MSIVVNTDFTGEYKVAKTCYDQIDFYIEKYERKYLLGLLGAELYTLFVADLTATNPQIPQTTRFLDIFNSIQLDEGSCIITSEGIRKMLTQLIYFHYVRENQVENTAGGTVRNAVELGTNASFMGNEVQAHNEGVRNSHAIQWVINDKSDIYPEENMQFLEYTSGI
tara:strand:- start:11112 stop:11612 length:501 start_codon:yes stop_codon:yes gene_type:complete